MIVDTSALVAIATGEPGWERLRHAINSNAAVIPAPVVTEFHLVMGSRAEEFPDAAPLIARFMQTGVAIAPFDERHASLSRRARELYGKRNGRGGTLNFGDLMVYAIAKQCGEPLLCTGRDFAATDLELHPASRLSP